MQYDEEWAFLGKKEQNCDPDDPDDQRQGDHWDHVGFDPEHRLVVVFGTVAAVMAALRRSPVSKAINTAFVERHNGTDRNRNARKVRKSYCFSKAWDVPQAVSYFTMYTYNFCWVVRTLREKLPHGQWRQRTAAMAAGLTDHVWSLREWLTHPSVQRS